MAISNKLVRTKVMASSKRVRKYVLLPLPIDQVVFFIAESAENRRGKGSIFSALLRVLCGSALRTITFKNTMSFFGGGTRNCV
jgi:hypothetical protein